MNTKLFLVVFTAAIAMSACGPKPSTYFKPQTDFRPQKTVAILPFNNYSGKEDAGKQVTNAFLVELLKKPFFKIIEPGEIDRVMREQRIRSSDQIDSSTAQVLRDSLGADYILIGAVNEFDYIKSGDRDVPLVGVSARLLDTQNEQIVWAANHSRKGDDKELIFNWGLVRSLSELTRNIVKDLVNQIKIHS